MINPYAAQESVSALAKLYGISRAAMPTVVGPRPLCNTALVTFAALLASACGRC